MNCFKSKAQKENEVEFDSDEQEQLAGGLKQQDLKHEGYFTRNDFQELYNASQKSHKGIFKDYPPYIVAINQSNHPKRKLLKAKAVFLQKDYKRCIVMLEMLNHKKSPSILWEKYALLIKAIYLDNPDNEERIKQVYKKFKEEKTECKGAFVSLYHENILKVMKNTALSHKQTVQKNKDLNRKKLRRQIRQYLTDTIFESLPSFLISKTWYQKFQNFIYEKQQAPPPGPITNFEIVNHMYELQLQPNISHSYMETVLFPVIQSLDYIIVTVGTWKYFLQLFGGIPIQRAFIKNPKYRVFEGGDTVCKFVFTVQPSKKLQIMQLQAGKHWQTTLLPLFYSLYGSGQLKEIKEGGEPSLVKPGKIQNIKNVYKFVKFDAAKIRAYQQTELETKRNLIFYYNMQAYEPTKSDSKGFLGITESPPHSTYFNSVIQILAHSYPFSDFLLTNSHLNQLNLSLRNKEGSFGEIVCALADIIKGIWFNNPDISYSIKADEFKEMVYSQFYEEKQINIHSQMCLPQKYKAINKIKKKPKSRLDRILEQKPKEKNIQRDPSLLLKILFKCMASDLSEERPNQFVQNQFTTKQNKFDDKILLQIYKNVLMQYHKFNKSIISNSFTGFHTRKIFCNTCSYKQFKHQPFRIYDIVVPHDSYRGKLYYIPAETAGDVAIKVQFFFEGLNTVEDILDLVRKQLEITDKAKIVPFLLDKMFNIQENELSHSFSTRNLYKSLQLSHKTLFLYEIFPLQNNEELALIIYRFQGFQKKLNRVDGFPRILPINTQILTLQNKQQLKTFILDTVPLAIYQAPRGPYIQKILHEKVMIDKKKKEKQKIFTTRITVSSKNQVNNFKFAPYKEIIGQRQPINYISLKDCIKNNIQPFLIGYQPQFYCKSCQKEQNSTIEDKINETGDILIIRLNRLGQKNQPKIQTMIQYPIIDLDLSQYIFGYPDKIQSHLKSFYSKQRYEKLLNKKNHSKYDLIGVIVHKGQSIEAGSFFTYIRLMGSKWCELSNQITKEVQNTQVLDTNAYLLIYLRKQLIDSDQEQYESKMSVESQDMIMRK